MMVTGPFLVAYILLWLTLMRALLVRARILPATCGRCGLPVERQTLGGNLCRCGHD